MSRRALPSSLPLYSAMAVMKEEIEKLLGERDGLMLGICNGCGLDCWPPAGG